MKEYVKLYEEYKALKFKTKEELEDFLDGFGIHYRYTINDDFSVDVDDNVNIENLSKYENRLPFQFGKVGGHFVCNDNRLNSLEGSPQSVGKSFSCSYNQLTSLKGCPSEIGGDFFCSYNQLNSLEFGPTTVGGDFFCNNNKLTSLEGCAKSVGGIFDCYNNKLTSLVFAPKPLRWSYYNNPCEKIYDRLGWTIEAHVEALKTLDPNPADTLRRLRPAYPERYFDIMSASNELRELVGESEELTDTYNKVKDIEKGYF